jgi:hypothetical protein
MKSVRVTNVFDVVNPEYHNPFSSRIIQEAGGRLKRELPKPNDIKGSRVK